MVLGDKSGLSDEVKQLYQENGIAHVLAISGLHISLIGASLFFVLRKYFMPMQGAAVVTMVLLFLYGILTGFSISTQRAVIMMGCMLLARLAGRHYDGLSALSFSAICQLLIHPMVLFQTGFCFLMERCSESMFLWMCSVMRGKVKIRFGWQLPERLVLSLLHFLFF